MLVLNYYPGGVSLPHSPDSLSRSFALRGCAAMQAGPLSPGLQTCLGLLCCCWQQTASQSCCLTQPLNEAHKQGFKEPFLHLLCVICVVYSLQGHKPCSLLAVQLPSHSTLLLRAQSFPSHYNQALTSKQDQEIGKENPMH